MAGEMTRDEFNALVEQWDYDTGFMSNTYHILQHDSYSAIMAEGEKVIPWILEDMRDTGGHIFWFVVLRELTGVNPIAYEDRGRVAIMKEAWLTWGRNNDFI